MIEKILERLEALTHDNPMVTDRYILRKDAIQIVQEVAKEYDWIPVSERLPKWEIEEKYTEDVHTVLQWYDGDITYGVGWYNKDFGWNEDCANCKVIAWKPIAPYQKGE